MNIDARVASQLDAGLNKLERRVQPPTRSSGRSPSQVAMFVGGEVEFDVPTDDAAIVQVPVVLPGVTTPGPLPSGGLWQVTADVFELSGFSTGEYADWLLELSSPLGASTLSRGRLPLQMHLAGQQPVDAGTWVQIVVDSVGHADPLRVTVIVRAVRLPY